MPKINCPHCGKQFNQNRPWQTFCSMKCRNDYHNKERKDAMSGRVKELEDLNPFADVEES